MSLDGKKCVECRHDWLFHAGLNQCVAEDRRRRDGLCRCEGWRLEVAE